MMRLRRSKGGRCERLGLKRAAFFEIEHKKIDADARDQMLKCVAADRQTCPYFMVIALEGLTIQDWLHASV